MRKLAILGAAVTLAAVTAAPTFATGADDKPQRFSLKGASLVESHDVFRNGELTETDFTVGRVTGHAVFDAKGGATYVAGGCRFVVTPGEDRQGYDWGWIVSAHALSGGPCPGVISGHYGPPK